MAPGTGPDDEAAVVAAVRDRLEAAELARQLTLTLSSPVWEAVRAPAPWQRPAREVAHG